MVKSTGNHATPISNVTPHPGLRENESLTDALSRDILLCIASHLGADDLMRAGAASRCMRGVELAMWRAIHPVQVTTPNASKLAWRNALRQVPPVFQRAAMRTAPEPRLSTHDTETLMQVAQAFERATHTPDSSLRPQLRQHAFALGKHAGLSMALLQALEAESQNRVEQTWSDRAARIAGSECVFAAAALAAAAWIYSGDRGGSEAPTTTPQTEDATPLQLLKKTLAATAFCLVAFVVQRGRIQTQ